MNRESVLHPRSLYSRLRLCLPVMCGLSIMLFTGCGSTKESPTTIAWQTTPPTSVAQGSTAQFAAIVNNDTANLGVSWLLTSCSNPSTNPPTALSAAECGSISRHTASGVPSTLVIPASATPGDTFTIEATSSANPSQSVLQQIAISPIVVGPTSIAFSPALPASMSIGTAPGIAAVVTNDHSDNNGNPLGCTLSVTCNDPNTGACGRLTSTTSCVSNYLPPSQVPAGGTVTFTTVSKYCSTATNPDCSTPSATTTVTITPPTYAIVLTQQPPASISAGAAINLAAKVTPNINVGNPAVVWSVTCTGGSGSTPCGSFNPQQTANSKLTSYTAPTVAPSGGTVTVTATSTVDSTKQATATINVTPVTLNNSLLPNGQYAFLLSGVNAYGPSALAGSITADGNGNIIAGEESLPGQTSLITGISGSYFIGSDGRGIMTLDGISSGNWLNEQQIFAITAVDSTHLFMEEFDGTGIYSPGTFGNGNSPKVYGSTLSGELELQKPGAFSVPVGPYAFAWADAGNPAPYAAYYGGVLNSDTNGNITSFYMDRYYDGTTDCIASSSSNNCNYGSSQSFSAPDQKFGHGTFTLGPYSFNYFMIGPGNIIVSASSSSYPTGSPAGHIYSQSSTAPSPAALAGSSYMFTLAGSTPSFTTNTIVGSSPEAIGGWFTIASGSNGNATVNGYLDTNNNGTVESAPVTGTLVQSSVSECVVNGVVACSRWILTLRGGGASQFAVYPYPNTALSSGHELLMFQLDTRKSGIGTALVQALSPTFQGIYAANIQQLGIIDPSRLTTVSTQGYPIGPWSDLSGQIVASGSSSSNTGTITGTLDIDQVNGLYLGLSGNLWTQTLGTSVTAGSYTYGVQGRYTGSITTNQPLPTGGFFSMDGIFYVVDNSTVLFLEDDATPAVGIIQSQSIETP